MITSRITPFLWLEGRAQEAAEFYVAVFRNARIISATRFGAGPAEGSATVAFERDGQPFFAFAGHPARPDAGCRPGRGSYRGPAPNAETGHPAAARRL